MTTYQLRIRAEQHTQQQQRRLHTAYITKKSLHAAKMKATKTITQLNLNRKNITWSGWSESKQAKQDCWYTRKTANSKQHNVVCELLWETRQINLLEILSTM